MDAKSLGQFGECNTAGGAPTLIPGGRGARLSRNSLTGFIRAPRTVCQIRMDMCTFLISTNSNFNHIYLDVKPRHKFPAGPMFKSRATCSSLSLNKNTHYELHIHINLVLCSTGNTNNIQEKIQTKK